MPERYNACCERVGSTSCDAGPELVELELVVEFANAGALQRLAFRQFVQELRWERPACRIQITVLQDHRVLGLVVMRPRRPGGIGRRR